MPPRKRRNKNRERKPDGQVTNRRGKPVSEERLRNIAADYGWAWSVLSEFPNVFRLFEQAVENNWSEAKFTAELQDSNWFKNHSDAWRQSEYLRLTDPKTYQSRVTEIRQQLADAAGSLGIEVNKDQLQEWSEQALRFGWDQAKINNVLANSVKIGGKHGETVGGSLADTKNRLEGFAWANGVHVSNKTMQKWLRQVVRGNSTVEEYEEYITKQAAAKFPNWQKQIKAGMTMPEIAEPYRQTMAQMLEVNPADIGLFDSTIARALSQKNEEGGYDSMTLTDFEDMLRRDPRWEHTDNAREVVAGIGASLAQTFGFLT